MNNVIENTAHIFRLIQLCYASGVRHAVVCSGSRCAPLLLGFGRHPSIETISVVDERSAGFIALGLSQQTCSPVALVCTSGTAALNFSPAIAEAFYQNVSLIVMTADRPPELIDQWDGQTIHQTNIYANYIQGGMTYTKDNQEQAIELLQCRGPVHFNIPVEEPFYLASQDKIEFKLAEVAHNNEEQSVDRNIWRELKSLLDNSGSVMILAGQLEPCPGLCGLLQEVGIPVAGDIASNLQGMPTCFRASDIKEPPDFLITIGRSIVSKRLRIFFRKNKPRIHWHIGRGMVGDPFCSLTKIIAIEAKLFFSEFIKQNLHCRGHNLRSTISVQEELEFCSLSAMARVLLRLPQKSVLHLGNSMPVRLAEYFGVVDQEIDVWSNRGTSGIDGVVSTAVGHALGCNDRLHTLIVGDLSFFYDRNGLWLNHKFPANLRIIILNNGGGGIFNMIDGPSAQGDLTKLFVMPHTRTAKLTAREFGLDYVAVDSFVELDMALMKNRFGIIEIFTDMKIDAKVFKTAIDREDIK